MIYMCENKSSWKLYIVRMLKQGFYAIYISVGEHIHKLIIETTAWGN